jgi:tape measure domain-containing protein
VADKNEIVIRARFNTEDLAKQMQQFSKKFQTALNNSLKTVSIDFGKLKVVGHNQPEFVNRLSRRLQTGLNAALKNVTLDASKMKGLSNIKATVKLDLKQAQKDIDAFRKKLAASPIFITTAATPPGTAPTAAPGPTPAGTTPPPTPMSSAPQLNERSIQAVEERLERLRQALRAQGITTKEAEGITKQYQQRLTQLHNTLRTLEAAQKVQGTLTDNQVRSSQVAREKLGQLRQEIKGYNTELGKSRIETKRAEEFMDSFGFRVGILGFGFGILGGYLQRATQGMIQFYTASAQAIEPLQRLQGLLAQSDRTSSERQTVFDEINRLADLPGGNLDSVVKSFRALAALKLGDGRVLELIEGLTKATALSGTGAEGTARLVEQLRQFVQSGVITERDIRTISEQGGVQVTDALQRRLGSLSPSKLEELGPERVVDALIEGLRELETPLSTSTDRLNRLENSFNRIRASILKVIDPGLESLEGTLKSLEFAIAGLAERFEQLTPDQKNAIGQFMVAIPVITGALAGLATALSAVGIGAATFNQATAALATIKTSLGLAEGTSTIAALGQGLTRIVGLVGRLSRLLGPIGVTVAVITAYITDAGDSQAKINDGFSRLGRSLEGVLRIVREFDFILDAISANLEVLSVTLDFIGSLLTDIITVALRTVAGVIDTIVSGINLLTNPNVENLKAFGKALYDTLKAPFSDLGQLFAASIMDALANIGETSFFGSLPGSQQATGFARSIADRIRNDLGIGRGASAGAGLSKFSQELNETEDSLSGLSEEARKLQDTFDTIGDALLQTSINLQRSLASFARENLGRAADRQARDSIRANPFLSNAEIDTFVGTRRNLLRQESARLTTADVQSAGLEASRTLGSINRSPILSRVLSTAGTKDAGGGEVKTLVDSLQKLVGLIAEGKTSTADLSGTITDIVTVSKNLGTGLDSLRKLDDGVFKELSDGEVKQVQEFLETAFKDIEKLQKAINSEKERELEINQNLIEYGEELKQQSLDLQNQAAADVRAQKVRLTLVDLRTRLAKEEEELQRLINEDLAGQAEQEQRIKELKDTIINQEALLSSEALSQADFVEQQRIELERVLKIEENREQTALETARRLREQARAAYELFRTSIAQSTQLAQQLRDQQNVALPFANPRTTGFDSVRQALASQTSLLEGDFRDLLASANNKFVQPFKAQMLGLFKQVTDEASDSFETLFERTNTEIQAALGDINNKILDSRAVIRDREAAGLTDAAAQERVKLQDLNLQADKYAKLQEFINEILGLRAQVLDNELQKSLQRLNIEQVNLQFMQEALELQQQRIELERRQTTTQASTGQIGLAETIRRIAKERQDSDAAEMRAIRQKYALLRNELDIREAILLAQAKTAGLEEAEVQKLKELFAARRKALGEQEQLEAEATESEDGVERQISMWEDLAEALGRVYGAAREARTAMKELYDQIASGEFILDSLHRWLMRDGSALDFFAQTATASFAAFGQAFASAVVQVATEGGKFLEIVGKIFGDVLIKLGTLLIQEAIMIPIMAFINALATGATIWQALGEMAASLPYAAIAAATGLALIAAGTAMGGGAAGATASSNTAGGADRATGAQRETFDPDKDPRLVYQKARMAEITIDIKTDDTQIVKTVIKHVNQNGRLTKLIGNRKLQFGY